MITFWALMLCLNFFTGQSEGRDIGTFWQVSDFHYDANYSLQGAGQFMCHAPKHNKSSNALGQFGNYECDSPWKLVESAVRAMKSIQPKADFILWTGDTVPHIPDSEFNRQSVYTVVGNVTHLLTTTFPKTPIYPTVGNHDTWPTSQVPVSDPKYYQSMADITGWKQFLNKDNMATFLKGGFYSSLARRGLRLLNLNTNMWYTNNKRVANSTDPSGQLAWLRQQLNKARVHKEKVWVVAHVPPGTLARVREWGWFYSTFNKRFLSVIEEYSDVIAAQFYGHEHTDSFRIFYDKHGDASVPVYVSPAVTPWKSTIPGMGSNNPSIRLYLYDRETGQPQDLVQYFLNLTEANQVGQAQWQVEYQATKAYGIANIQAPALHQLVHRFLKPSSPDLQKYYHYNSVSYDTVVQCTGQCQQKHVCSITRLDYDQYKECMTLRPWPSAYEHKTSKLPTVRPLSTSTGNHHHHRHYGPMPRVMYVLIVSLVVFLILTFIFVSFICCRRRGGMVVKPPKYMPINA